MADSPAWPRGRDFVARPLLWRVPLVLFVLVGLAGVAGIDALLRRDIEREAARHAEQVQALLAARLRDRASHLHALSLALGALGDRTRGAASFTALSRELHGAAPEVVSVTLVDTLGRVRDRLLRRSSGAALAPEERDPSALERAIAVATAVRLRRLTITPTITLRDGSAGVILYEPLDLDGKVVGAIGIGIAHARLLDQALVTHLRGRFPHRVRDGGGDVIARAPRWPDHPQRVVTRAVALPDGRPWLVDIAVPRFEPFLPRLLTGMAGLLLIALVVAMVVREAHRGERLREHSLQLEVLSRDLLDANVTLEERAAQVAEATRAKSRFLANVSHELRTPINAIVGYNALALEGMYGALPRGLEEAHERIRLAARHLLALVDDVLDLSRIEAGRMAIDAAPVDLRGLLDAVVTIIAPTAAAKGVQVDVVAARDLPRLTTDAQHLRQILLNLASNAVKFTERGSVTLVARRDPADPAGHVLLVVEDTGIGIAEADQARIFEEFEQVQPDARGDSLRRGTGLGLAIVRRLARLLGGDVTVSSAPGAGAAFSVRLPLVAPPSPAADEAPSATTVARGTPRHSPARHPTPLPAEPGAGGSTTVEIERAVARSRERGDALADLSSGEPASASAQASAHASAQASAQPSAHAPTGGRDAARGVDAPNSSD